MALGVKSSVRADRRRAAFAGILMMTTALSGLAMPAIAQAQSASATASRTFNIPAQSLNDALTDFGQQSGLQVSVDAAQVRGLTSPGVTGALPTLQALSQLLINTGFTFRVSGNVVTLEKAPQAAGGAIQLGPVRVEGEGGNSSSGRYAEIEETATSPVQGYIAKRSATGTKTDTRIIETPQSISVVTADYIEAIGATRLRDAIAYTPGVNIAPYGSDSRFDWIVLRGFDAYAPGYYLDGMQMKNVLTWSTWQTESYGLERIEILRGPTSVLYGQNTTGGMINLVSKRPSATPLHEIQAQIGTDNRYQIAADFSGPIDSEGKFLYRLTGLVRDADLSVAGLPNNRIYIAPSLTWKPSDDTSFTLLSHYLRVRAGTSNRVLPLVGTLLPNPNGSIPLSRYFGEPGYDYYHQNQWMIGYELDHRFNDTWSLRHAARYGELESNYRNILMFGDYVKVDFDNADNPANFRLARRRPIGSNEDSHTFTTDTNVKAKFQIGGFSHTILFGIDHQRTRFDTVFFNGGSAQSLDVFTPSYGGTVVIPSSYNRDQNVKSVQTGIYVQDQIRFLDNLIATIGGRFDSAETKSNNRLTGDLIEHGDQKFSGRAGLVYLHPSGFAPYISFAESFFPTTTIDPATGDLFEPETGRQYEAGIRYQPVGREDSYSIAVFDLRRQNYVTYDPDYNPRQTGEVTVRGLEFEAHVKPVEEMNLTASYTWTPKAEVTKSSTPSEIGTQIDPVSEHQFTVWSDYRFSNGLKFGAGARYVGSNDRYSRPVKVPAYTLFDAMIGYDFGPWSLSVNARNLTDKDHITNAYVTGNFGRVWVGDERSVIGTLSYRW